MGTRKRILTPDELARPFDGAWADQFPPILSPAQFADLIGLSRKTVYAWIAEGRLDGSFRKRGKHILIWRAKALDQIFNGPTWGNDHEQA
jgi:excisionase family DNA binding protein